MSVEIDNIVRAALRIVKKSDDRDAFTTVCLKEDVDALRDAASKLRSEECARILGITNSG